jgi:hypothetical protein
MPKINNSVSLDETNDEFKSALEFVLHTDKTVYLTGKAGTGKTTFLRHLRETTSKKAIILAPTGVAAINANGQTIHSFFQLPFGPFILNDKRLRASKVIDDTDETTIFNTFKYREDKKNIIKELELLIIDEVSMVRCDTLDVIDRILRVFRKKTFLPFGGVQVVLIGDTFQLPPIAKFEQWEILKNDYESPFFFSSKVFKSNKPIYIEFKKIYRQKEQEFIDLLNKIRTNQINEFELNELNKKFNPLFTLSNLDSHIILSTTNNEVNKTNATKLHELDTVEKVFKGELAGIFPKDTKGDFVLPTELNLQLKVGAQVMILKNDSGESKKYFNGKIGKIESLEENRIIVQFSDESKVRVEKAAWNNIQYTWNKDEKKIQETTIGTFLQYPLRLAWAITVHKSQGLTFENVYADLGSAFEDGQVYVALSRCTSLNGLVLKSKIPRDRIMTNKEVLEFAKTETPSTLIIEELTSGKADYYYRKAREEIDGLNFNDAYNNFIKAIKIRDDIGSDAFKRYFITIASKLGSYKLKQEKLSHYIQKIRQENENYEVLISDLKNQNVNLETKIEDQNKTLRILQDTENELNIKVNQLKHKINELAIINSKHISVENRNIVVEIFERNPVLFVDLISGYYPLNIDLIESYKDRWDWEKMSMNTNIPWSIEMVGKYYEKWDPDLYDWDNSNNSNWDWYNLSLNESLPWSSELIEKFEDKWSWYNLSLNESLPWSIELIDKFKDSWDWKWLPENKSIPWSIELIKKFKHKWDWIWLFENKSLPWSIELIEEYEDKWNWEWLSRKKSLPWSIELIEKFADKWSWFFLSSNESLPWSIELIEKFADKWDRYSLSSNKSLPWSIELIIKFADKWNWDWLFENKSLPWSIELIEKFEDKWNWIYLSSGKNIPWSIELIEKFEDKWSWYSLSSNESLQWSIELIEKFEDKWSWDILYKNESIKWTIEQIQKYRSKWTWYSLSNKSFPWSIELIEEHEDKLNWDWLSSNKCLPWSIELIDKFKDRWNWDWLSWNRSRPWSIEIVEKFEDNWCWENLSTNESLPWSIELLERFQTKWNWRKLSNCCVNTAYKSFPWSIELIRKFEDKWDWSYLSKGKNIPWSIELIEKYQDKWNWSILSQNESLSWSIEFIEKFKYKWDWERLCLNQSLPWAIDFFEKYLNEIHFYNPRTESLPWYMRKIRESKDKWDKETLSSKIILPFSINFTHQFAEKIEASKSVFETLEPYIDDEIINKVFRKYEEVD